jgi:hypothetical protein
MIRYVAGGHEVISHVTHSNNPLKDFSIIPFMLLLRTEDWGWLGLSVFEGTMFSSFDRETRVFTGPVVESPNGSIRAVGPLVSPLLENPLNGLYVV